MALVLADRLWALLRVLQGDPVEVLEVGLLGAPLEVLWVILWVSLWVTLWVTLQAAPQVVLEANLLEGPIIVRILVSPDFLFQIYSRRPLLMMAFRNPNFFHRSLAELTYF